ncbi:thiamine diphosphokinase [Clostridium sp. MT-14]|uniref:Thiamine diphosphokinase n=1 Tax=Clostridium aromativorans TaxID=2836848 RepID=A0ABS8N4D6_9CLOT|nr:MULTISPECIES: thiamine diphosphokinase [Clostridium]KAA8677051.1 thiamine diphosphokinase [Clostridium sp. HV4-5-A1G]MCC9294666.1 thiamine diphosphokinase [Clostridium aromativorans]
MRVVIVSGGNAPSEKLIKEELYGDSILICADSGANCLYRYNIVPMYLMGDFDSIDEEPLKFFREKNCIIEKYPKAKNCTDTEIVIDKALSLRADEIVLLGVTGSRVDHLLGNLGMLLKCNSKGIRAFIKDEHNTIELISKPVTIKGREGETFSLHAYCDIVRNLSIIGARYKLDNYDLKLGDGRTISNEFLNRSVSIIFDSGKLLLMKSRD